MCKLGKAQSLHSEATQRSLPVLRLNLRGRDGGGGFEVRWVGTKSCKALMSIWMYCAFNQQLYILMRCYDVHTTELLLERTCLLD